jgi:hypothetical protein
VGWLAKRMFPQLSGSLVVGRRGLEPRTYGLKVHSSAIELAARGFTGYR